MSSKWPSASECWQRLEAAGPAAWVLDHVQCVSTMAVAMAHAANRRGHAVDTPLVEAGAILHDIGRSITQDPTHAHQGATLLRTEGWDEELVRIVERHTGAGLTPDAAEALGLPPGKYIPQTLEERIVAHADNLYSGSRRLTLEEIKAKYHAKGLEDAFTAIVALHQEMSEIVGTDLDVFTPDV